VRRHGSAAGEIRELSTNQQLIVWLVRCCPCAGDVEDDIRANRTMWTAAMVMAASVRSARLRTIRSSRRSPLPLHPLGTPELDQLFAVAK
jgi:hypothetical protein